MWSARQTWKMGRRAAGFLGGLLATILLVAAPEAAAFVEPIKVSPNSASVPSGSPAIAINARRVFVAWKEGDEIYFRRSQPTEACGGGLKFDDNEGPQILWPRTVTPTGTVIKPSAPALAANDRGLFVAWQASSAVWFQRSFDDGAPGTFSSAISLGPNGSANNPPSVAADNTGLGGVFVAWSNGSNGSVSEILLARSMNSGDEFEAATPVTLTQSTPSSPRTSVAPSVAAGGGNVFLAWVEKFGSSLVSSSIRYKKFDRMADLTTVAGLDAPELSTGVPFSRALSPNLAFGNDVLSVAFVGFNAVYHRSSRDGTTFSPALSLAPDIISGQFAVEFPDGARPARRKDKESAIVAWAQSLASPDIRYLLLGSSDVKRVWDSTARRGSPTTAIDSTGRLLVAWQGREAQTPALANDEIYISYDDNGGTGGGAPMDAFVEMNPQTLNAKTVDKGVGVVTLRIRIQGWTMGNLVSGSLTLNGLPVEPLRSSVVDPDTLELKIERSKLGPVLAGATLKAAEPKGNDTSFPVAGEVTGNGTGQVTGNTSKACFSGAAKVRVIP